MNNKDLNDCQILKDSVLCDGVCSECTEYKKNDRQELIDSLEEAEMHEVFEQTEQMEETKEEDIQMTDETRNEILKEMHVHVSVLSSQVINSPFANGYCRKYYLKLYNRRGTYTFTYHGSVYDYCNHKRLDKLNVIYCVLMDASAYDNCRDIDDFASEFGYDTPSKLIKAYEGCEKASQALRRMFNSEELERLQDLFQDY